jgi:hypothetical protein
MKLAVVVGAEALKVIIAVVIGSLNRVFVVYKRCGRYLPFLSAQFAQRIGRKKSGADFAPCPAVSFICFGVSLETVILLGVFFAVLFAVISIG